MSFEKYILPDRNANEPAMDIGLLESIFIEYAQGVKTGAECISAIESRLKRPVDPTLTLSADDKTDLQAIASIIDVETGFANKYLAIIKIIAVLKIASVKGDKSIGWYDTREKIKTRLSWI